jgi:hypothetical protein
MLLMELSISVILDLTSIIWSCDQYKSDHSSFFYK